MGGGQCGWGLRNDSEGHRKEAGKAVWGATLEDAALTRAQIGLRVCIDRELSVLGLRDRGQIQISLYFSCSSHVVPLATRTVS